MSFLLRRSRYTSGHYSARADQHRTAAASSGVAEAGTEAADADARPAFALLTDSDLRAVAGRASAADAFSDGLPIRMSLD
jgi:hypothetical protein